jgi:hypothetical protein
MKRWYWFPFKLLAFAALLGLFVWLVMLLWNALVPALFTGPVVTFWQTAGLLVLCRVLFGGFGWHRGGHFRMGMWRYRYSHMTPEERERFRQGFRRWKGME